MRMKVKTIGEAASICLRHILTKFTSKSKEFIMLKHQMTRSNQDRNWVNKPMDVWKNQSHFSGRSRTSNQFYSNNGMSKNQHKLSVRQAIVAYVMRSNHSSKAGPRTEEMMANWHQRDNHSQIVVFSQSGKIIQSYFCSQCCNIKDIQARPVDKKW